MMTVRPNHELNSKKLNRIKLVPFNHISTLVRLSIQPELSLKKIRSTLVDLFGNIGLFIPFGAASGLVLGRKKRVTWTQILIISGIGLFFSLFIETAQLWISTRVTDIDDVIFNSSGSFLGAVFISLGHSGYGRISWLLNSRRFRRPSPIVQSI